MGNTKSLPEIHRGAADVRMPGTGLVLVSALDAQNIGPQVSNMLTFGPLSMVMYFHTPVRLRIHHPMQAWRNIHAGTAILLEPGARWQVDTRPAGAASRHTWAALDGLTTSPLFARLHSIKRYAEFQDTDGILARQFLALIDVIEEHKASPFWCMQVQGRVIMDTLCAAERQTAGHFRIAPSSSRRKPDPLVGRAVAYMETHIGEKVTLATLARHLNAGASTLSHRFRAFTGEAPMQTLKRMRMIRARIMLLQGHLVTDIANTLGFYDEHHFSLAFKKVEGLSPRAFIKRERGLKA